MSVSSSSSVQAAREMLGKRLRQIRKDAGIPTARALAMSVGWHEAKCSRIERGITTPSRADLQTWVRQCETEDQLPDLVATLDNIEGAYVEYRTMEKSGLRHAQQSVMGLWEQTISFRAYSSWLVPGPFQTRAYVEALLRSIQHRRSLPDDIDAAVEIRMGKQRLLQDGAHRFALVLEESVLRNRIGGIDTMAGQLGQLLSLATLPNVSLGVIPATADRTALWPVEDFWIFDEARVNVELVSAFLTVTQPREIRQYAQTFSRFVEQAKYGSDARMLITTAIDALG